PEVLVLVANRLPAAAEAIKELLELLGAHALAVVGDHPAIDAFRRNGLPLDAELDFCRPCFDCIDRGLADPLEFGALAITALDHRRDAIGVHLSNHNENPPFALPSVSVQTDMRRVCEPYCFIGNVLFLKQNIMFLVIPCILAVGKNYLYPTENFLCPERACVIVRGLKGDKMPQEPRTHLRFRIEPQLQKQLEKARKESGRTLTAEITERLKQSFSDDVSGADLEDFRKYLTEMRLGMMDEI